MSRVTHHSVPRFLTQDQRDDRMSTCGDLVDSADKDDGKFLNEIITGDKAWDFMYYPQPKPGNRHHRQERRNRDRTGQKTRQCLDCFSTPLELFT
jgi:hypothetical protein